MYYLCKLNLVSVHSSFGPGLCVRSVLLARHSIICLVCSDGLTKANELIMHTSTWLPSWKELQSSLFSLVVSTLNWRMLLTRLLWNTEASWTMVPLVNSYYAVIASHPFCSFVHWKLNLVVCHMYLWLISTKYYIYRDSYIMCLFVMS